MNKSYNKNTEIELKLLIKLRKIKTILKDLFPRNKYCFGSFERFDKKFVNKGFLKLSQAPMKRYFYYITPRGLIEKAK